MSEVVVAILPAYSTFRLISVKKVFRDLEMSAILEISKY